MKTDEHLRHRRILDLQKSFGLHGTANEAPKLTLDMLLGDLQQSEYGMIGLATSQTGRDKLYVCTPP